MKIYKGDTGIELTVQAFLDLLEEDALDEAINMVLDMEAMAAEDGDGYTYMGTIHMSGDFDGDMDGLFEHITNNIDHYEIIDEEDFESAFGIQSGLGQAFYSDQEIQDNFALSKEDLRIKRMVQQFRHIEEAS